MTEDARPSAEEVRSLLVEILQGATEDDRWARLVGPVTLVPIWLNPRSNWDVDASGSTADRAAIAKAVEIVSALHPYARG